ncbi:hypothetical protein NC652_010880 [Populus alba x Populus x berolinensis]|nr:hypothetical protein NC652_010880 [Populus alba x Populus x berolinensis]
MKTGALTSLRGKIHGIMIRVTAHSCNTCMKMTSTKESKFKEILPTKAIQPPIHLLNDGDATKPTI